MNWLRKWNRRRSIFITILLSYIAILLLPVLIGTYLYHRVENIMVNNANRTNLGLLEQVKQVTENRMNEVDSMTVQIALNPKLQWAMSNIDDDYVKSEFNMVDIMKDLKNVRNVNSFIGGFYVYFKNTGQILTTVGKTTASSFFKDILVYNNKSDDWPMKELLTGYKLKSYVPVNEIKEGGTTSNVITYVQSLPLGEKDNVKGYLVVLIQEQELERLITQIQKVNNGAIYIVDSNQQVMLSSVRDNKLSEDLLNRLGNEDGYNTYDLDGNKMMISYTSGNNGWKYISIVPRQMVLEQVIAVKNWAVISMLVCLIAGIVASYFMAYRNYSPIHDVMKTIMASSHSSRGDTDNEFDYIKRSIIHSFDEKNRLKQTLSQNAPVIQANFLSRLLKGHIEMSALTDDSLSFMGVHFPHALFNVALLEIDDCHDFIKEDTEREWALVRFVLMNVGGNLLEENGYIVELDRNRLAVLINSSGPEEQAMTQLIAFVEQLQDVAQQRFKLKITLAVSQFHVGIESIAKCYREALIALNYRMVQGSNTIYFMEIADLEHHAYHYPLETEVQLMNYAKSGDYANAERLLDSIYEANFQAGGISPDMSRFLFIDLLSTIVKALNGFHMSDKKLFEGSTDPAKVLSGCATIEEMLGKTKEMYRKVCRYTREEKTEHGDRLYSTITRYIDDHYFDGSLSVSSMADHFQLSLQYLSTFFKKHSGENITDYIAAVRIREAKRMLADRTLTMGEIAQKIGYNNTVSFFRLFKKVEGMPPGKYRELLDRTSDV